MDDLSALQRELRGLVHDQLQLAALELRLAAHSLMTMIAAAVCIGALLVAAWLGLMGAAGLGLIGMGLEAAMALLVLVALTLVLAGLAGAIFTADWRGGVAHVKADGTQALYRGEIPGGRPARPNGIALRRDGSFLFADLGAEQAACLRFPAPATSGPSWKQ